MGEVIIRRGPMELRWSMWDDKQPALTIHDYEHGVGQTFDFEDGDLETTIAFLQAQLDEGGPKA